MKLLAGTYLKSDIPESELLINNTFAKFLGFKNPQDAVGISIIKMRNQFRL
jgi:hypothetical protein